MTPTLPQFTPFQLALALAAIDCQRDGFDGLSAAFADVLRGELGQWHASP